MFINKTSKVVLPEWILNQKDILSEQNFRGIVMKYLRRYPYYRFIKVEDGFAVCDRMEIQGERRKKR